jgi:FHS family L-fucose permease-like MFS transporter
MTQNHSTKTYLLPFILVTSIFFMWGVANTLNSILIKQFQKSFDLSDFQSGMVQAAFYMGYFLLAIPAAQLMKRQGYKAAIILGLILYGAGALLFYPAAEINVYGVFLFSLFVIASGLAFLETASNPFVAILGPVESSEKRLNLSQSFNSLGAIMGIVIGRYFIFSGIEYTPEQLANLSTEQLQAFYDAEMRSVQMPYLIIGILVLLWALLIKFSKFPELKHAHTPTTETTQGWKNLLKHRHFIWGVIALFMYVGAQVGTWSYLINYSQNAVPGTNEMLAADYLTFSLIGLMVGRFSSTWMMRFFKPANIMAVFAGANVILVMMAVFFPGMIGIWSLIISSFFMSLMFPTIFALAIKGLGNDTQIGSSVMIMAIIGSAVMTALMGVISDHSSIVYAYIVPIVCYAYILWYSIKGYQPQK